MRIEVNGPFNEGGSSWPLWIYEIDAGCDRVLVDLKGNSRGNKVWGFKDGRQVEGQLVESDPASFVTG